MGIVFIYYILAYNPNVDPFEEAKDDTATQSRRRFKPNAIDIAVLSLIRRGKKANLLGTHDAAHRCDRIRPALEQCMLVMSDLQLLTGLSILISGYTQIQCGISTYHWKILVSLAWLCSTTHLCCLTFLRSYLYKRPFKRLWRVLGMSALVIMLIVALVPTGHYVNRSYENILPAVVRPMPADFVICYLWHADTSGPQIYSEYISALLQLNKEYMIASSVLLASGMILRFVKLHRGSSNLFFTMERQYDIYSDWALCKIYNWSHTAIQYPTLGRALIYRPVLSVFLVTRTLIDLWSSMAFEVSTTFL